MSPYTPARTDWATLGKRVAKLHLDLAVRDNDDLADVRTNLAVLGSTVATGLTVPPDFRRAYDDSLVALTMKCCCPAEALMRNEGCRRTHDGIDDEDW